VTGSSAALAAVFFLLITVGAALAYLIAGSGNNAATSGLNDLAWACVVIVSFPAAMLIMAGTFGLWWAGLISKRSSGPDWQRSYSSCWAEQRGLATDFWHGTVLIRSSSRRDRPCVGDGRLSGLFFARGPSSASNENEASIRTSANSRTSSFCSTATGR
jgi:hypothetical protein